MKTFILQLEQHDDIISTRDKMGWGKAGRILLVWPEHGQVLNHRLDLVLLQRHSIAQGAQLAVVTRDPEVRYWAPRLGIPMFKTLRRAQSAHWRIPRHFRKAQPEGAEGIPEKKELHQHEPLAILKPASAISPLKTIPRLVFFTLGVLGFLSITAVLLPSARITLAPKIQSQEISIDVQANPAVTEINLSGVVPARPITVTVEGREALPVSGSIQVPNRPAIGTVRFTNLTDQAVKIPEGTVVRTLDKKALRYIVTQPGVVPPGPGETLSLPVRCLAPGSQGNVPAGSLVAIEGLLGTQLSVTNLLPTSTGADRREPAPSANDRSQLANRLSAALQQTARKELENLLADGDILLPSSLKLLRTLDENYQPAENLPADQLSLNLRMEFQALIVSREDLRSLAQAVLDANLPVGYMPLEQTLEYENLAAPVSGQDSTAYWKLHAARQIQAQLPQPKAIQLSLGLAPAQARGRLENALPLQEPPQIMLTPAWWPRLPFLPFRIMIINQGATGQAIGY
jgi:hypothetical protein